MRNDEAELAMLLSEDDVIAVAEAIEAEDAHEEDAFAGSASNQQQSWQRDVNMLLARRRPAPYRNGRGPRGGPCSRERWKLR